MFDWIEILHDCCISWQIYVSFFVSSVPPPNRAGAPFLEKPHNFVRIAGRYCRATTTDSTALKQTEDQYLDLALTSFGSVLKEEVKLYKNNDVNTFLKTEGC